ncbi:hypothetical protein D3C78_969750 [compost metagenome]
MVLLNKPAILSELLERKQLLYKKLLDCSSKQVVLINLREEETFSLLFQESTDDWNNIVTQIKCVEDEEQTIFNGHNIDQGPIIKLLQQINDNVDFVQRKLEESELDVESNMALMNNQKKIMNAYFGAHITDSSSIYFDEKK